ncbi:MAG: peptide-methionine (S)-S-oxide reductase, partial [Anaerolineae bacterium]|nr:peptide-methionine (S)-S-oxide reductase [Anaerolineae bacterium]
TSLNRQGHDIGSQYRSMILYADDDQRVQAEAFIRKLEAGKAYDRPIVTEVKPLGTFYPAEAYHQEYYRNNPNQGYCRVVIAPKVAKFRKQYLERLKA